jgi:hypothetical protein
MGVMEALDKARLCLRIIKERKAVDPVLFEVGKLTSTRQLHGT